MSIAAFEIVTLPPRAVANPRIVVDVDVELEVGSEADAEADVGADATC